jgi:hypothetical protein
MLLSLLEPVEVEVEVEVDRVVVVVVTTNVRSIGRFDPSSGASAGAIYIL